MIRDLALNNIPPRRIEQIRAVRDHLKRAFDTVKEVPVGLPEPIPVAREAANSIKTFQRLYAGLDTVGARETALRSLMRAVLLEDNVWQALESVYAQRELGDEIHPFILGTARFGAGNTAGAVEAFRLAASGPHGSFARLCLARSLSIGGNEMGAREALEKCLDDYPGYLPAIQELGTVEYRLANFAKANAWIDSVREPLEHIIRTAPRAANIPNLDAEIIDALANKTLVRPKGPGKDLYTEAMCEWYWRDMWWHMNTFSRFQHPLAWLGWVYETTIDEVLTNNSSLDTVINFGALCCEPEYRLSKKHPRTKFIGVDRERATKRLNETAYGDANMEFIAGNVDEHLATLVKKGTTMLFHARTGTLCYPQYMRNLYAQCAKLGVKTIALFENNALERRSLRYWDYAEMPADSLPYIESMFIHNYPKYFEEAGYEVTRVHRLPYSDLFHMSQDVGSDGHVVMVAKLK